MKGIKSLIVAVALGSPVAMAEDCVAPEPPALPDGSSASYDDMIAGQGAVKAYQASNLEYMNCLDPQIAAAAEAAQADGASEEDVAKVKALEEAYNGAVSSEEELAGQFNAAIRAYKEANPQ